MSITLKKKQLSLNTKHNKSTKKLLRVKKKYKTKKLFTKKKNGGGLWRGIKKKFSKKQKKIQDIQQKNTTKTMENHSKQLSNLKHLVNKVNETADNNIYIPCKYKMPWYETTHLRDHFSVEKNGDLFIYNPGEFYIYDNNNNLFINFINDKNEKINNNLLCDDNNNNKIYTLENDKIINLKARDMDEFVKMVEDKKIYIDNDHIYYDKDNNGKTKLVRILEDDEKE